ncbi:N-6 DNA methylase [Cesiribacter sp. SM1]|uniref:N-6 DNA methylase n=1 Tax=Cesiribacter sp. SM1 TaxID=2861196 RepID=UPI001CD32370|nr:N-6 DNA methylase [Cesiribacter sp. SM1]
MHKELVSKFYKIRNILVHSGVSQSYEQAMQFLWIIVQSLVQEDRISFVERMLGNTEHRLNLIGLNKQNKENLFSLINDIDPVSTNELRQIMENFPDLISSLQAHYFKSSTASGIWKVSQDVINLSIQLANTKGSVLIQNLEPWEVSKHQLHGVIIPPRYSSLDLAEDIAHKLRMDLKVINSVGGVQKGQYQSFIAFPPLRAEGSKSLTPTSRRKTYLSEESIVDGLATTTATGKIIVFAESSFLTDSNRKEVRKFLLEQDLLELVISLPAGMVQQTNITTCLLVLNKSKDEREGVRFVDAKSFRTQVDAKFFGLAHEKLIETIVQDKTVENTAVTVNVHEVTLNDFDLSPGRYLFEAQYKLEPSAPEFNNNPEAPSEDQRGISYDDGIGFFYPGQEKENIVKLGDILTFVPHYTRNVTGEFVAYITPKDLNESWREEPLTEKEIKFEKLFDAANGNNQVIVKGEMFLLSNILSSKNALKPTFAKFSTEAVLPPTVFALKIKDNAKVDITYLLQELSSDFVLEQLEFLSTGEALPRISRKNLLSLRLRIPTIQEQKARVEIALEAQQVLAPLIDRLQKQLAQRDQELNEGFKIFKHNFGQHFTNFRSTLSVLQFHLSQLDKQNAHFSLDEPIGRNNKPVRHFLDMLNNFLDEAANSLDTEDDLLNVAKKDEELHEVNIKDFVQEHILPLFTGQEFAFEEEITLDAHNPLFNVYYSAMVNRNLLIKIFNNLISNAKLHGFSKGYTSSPKIKLEVAVGADIDDKYYAHFYVYNNGNPLPQDFTVDILTKRGLHAGETGNTGYGGYTIYKCLEVLNGEISVVKPVEGYTVGFGFDIPIYHKFYEDESSLD